MAKNVLHPNATRSAQIDQARDDDIASVFFGEKPIGAKSESERSQPPAKMKAKKAPQPPDEKDKRTLTNDIPVELTASLQAFIGNQKVRLLTKNQAISTRAVTVTKVMSTFIDAQPDSPKDAKELLDCYGDVGDAVRRPHGIVLDKSRWDKVVRLAAAVRPGFKQWQVHAALINKFVVANPEIGEKVFEDAGK